MFIYFTYHLTPFTAFSNLKLQEYDRLLWPSIGISLNGKVKEERHRVNDIEFGVCGGKLKTTTEIKEKWLCDCMMLLYILETFHIHRVCMMIVRYVFCRWVCSYICRKHHGWFIPRCCGSLVPRPQQGRVHQQHVARHCDFVVHPLLMSVSQFALCSLPWINWVGSTKCQSAATVLAASSKRFVARNSAGLRGCACRRSEGVQILSDVSEPAPAFFIILVAQRSWSSDGSWIKLVCDSLWDPGIGPSLRNCWSQIKSVRLENGRLYDVVLCVAWRFAKFIDWIFFYQISDTAVKNVKSFGTACIVRLWLQPLVAQLHWASTSRSATWHTG